MAYHQSDRVADVVRDDLACAVIQEIAPEILESPLMECLPLTGLATMARFGSSAGEQPRDLSRLWAALAELPDGVDEA